MAENVVNQITQALDELQGAIARAKSSLVGIEAQDKALASRILSYEQILAKQRTLVGSLGEAASAGRWEEVRRLAELVRASSLLIKVDAGFMMESIRGTTPGPGGDFQA